LAPECRNDLDSVGVGLVRLARAEFFLEILGQFWVLLCQIRL
jgi:hypothetical protein